MTIARTFNEAKAGVCFRYRKHDNVEVVLCLLKVGHISVTLFLSRQLYECKSKKVAE
jgi:hypothetical protein